MRFFLGYYISFENMNECLFILSLPLYLNWRDFFLWSWDMLLSTSSRRSSWILQPSNNLNQRVQYFHPNALSASVRPVPTLMFPTMLFIKVIDMAPSLIVYRSKQLSHWTIYICFPLICEFLKGKQMMSFFFIHLSICLFIEVGLPQTWWSLSYGSPHAREAIPRPWV